MVVDVQNDFTEGGSLAVKGGNVTATAIADYIRDNRGEYTLIIASRDWHSPSGDNGGHFAAKPDMVTTWPPHCVQGTTGSAYNPAIETALIDISVAVSAPNGLVVPVIRDAQDLSVANIERTIGDFGKRAKEGTLTMEDMKGGTFTISNGGVFGSLMSTPIINPPQSAVLGLHRIEDRPVVRDGQIVIRPMMYLALSYDHRLIDGREAVTFLVAVKNAIEDPTRLLIDL